MKVEIKTTKEIIESEEAEEYFNIDNLFFQAETYEEELTASKQLKEWEKEKEKQWINFDDFEKAVKKYLIAEPDGNTEPADIDGFLRAIYSDRK